MNLKLKRLHIMVTAAVALLLSACSSTPNTYSNTDPNADFNSYRSYAFLQELSTDKENYASLESAFLKVAVAQQMDIRGYEYAPNPDLLVNFYIHTQDKVKSRQVPTMGGYYGYRDPFYGGWGGYGMGGYETQIDSYTEGTLNVDIVDARTKKLVWEGAIVGRITESVVKNLEKSIDSAVYEIYKNFPVQAPEDIAATGS
jgi:hypothetical protein